MFDGGIPIEKVSEILYGISELWPEKDAESVTYLQKWEYVMSVEGLDEVQQDSVLRAYMAYNRHAIFILLPVPSVVASCYILRNLQCNIVHISAHRRLLCTVVHAYSGINLQLKL